MEKDIIIIGGGPGGYVAAIRAAQLGAKVCLIEKEKLGGTCLNRGCIPTKALYRSAEIIQMMQHIDDFGIDTTSFDINTEKIQSRKQGIVQQLVGGIGQLLNANGVETINGMASFKDGNTVTILMGDGSTKEMTAKHIIIASGSKPFVPPIPGADLKNVVTSDDLLEFDHIPKRLTIVGGGVIGLEFAGIFNAMGSQVNVIEFLPNILAQIDTDLTKRLTASLKKKGIEINTATKVTKLENSENGLVITAEGKKGEMQIAADMVLMAVGRQPLIEGLNLEAAGVEFTNKGIKVNESYETNIKNIYAIGDVTGGIMLAHVASHQGIIAVEKIMGAGHHAELGAIPNCVFVFPEIASAGITEDEAKAQGLAYKTGKFMFGANGKALTLGEGEGMVKVIAALDDTILGVHIMGPHASDLVHEGVLAINHKMKAEDIIKTIHAHPTLSESFSEAVMGLKGIGIHSAPLRKN